MAKGVKAFLENQVKSSQVTGVRISGAKTAKTDLPAGARAAARGSSAGARARTVLYECMCETISAGEHPRGGVFVSLGARARARARGAPARDVPSVS
eukprot:COSAG02_NODE_1166_length_14154_cov_19.442191_1_plen_97_part_00